MSDKIKWNWTPATICPDLDNYQDLSLRRRPAPSDNYRQQQEATTSMTI